LTTPYKFHIFIVRKLNKKQKTKKMKKILVVFAILSATVLASCGGKGVSTEVTDSTEVVVDTTVVEEVEVGGGSPGSIDEEKNTQGEAVK
jgi:hypothetical protein